MSEDDEEEGNGISGENGRSVLRRLLDRFGGSIGLSDEVELRNSEEKEEEEEEDGDVGSVNSGSPSTKVSSSSFDMTKVEFTISEQIVGDDSLTDEDDTEIVALYTKVETSRFQSSSLDKYADTSTFSSEDSSSSSVTTSPLASVSTVLRLPIRVRDESTGITEPRRGLFHPPTSTTNTTTAQQQQQKQYTYLYERHLKNSLFGETAKYRAVSSVTPLPDEHSVPRSATPVCVKESVLNWRTHANASRTKDNPENELKMMLRLHHLDSSGSHHIVRLMDILKCDEWLYLICECYDIVLLDHMVSNGAKSEQDAFRIFSEVLDAVTFLHANKIAHLDISAENIMLDFDGHVRLIDFGQACCFDDDDGDSELRGVCGKAAYYIPESVRAMSFCAFEQDIWALGIVLFVLVVGTIPYVISLSLSLTLNTFTRTRQTYILIHRYNAPYTTDEAYQILCQNNGSVPQKTLMKNWRAGNCRSGTPRDVPDDLLDLMCGLMSHNYTSRIRSLRGIVNSPWFQRMLRESGDQGKRLDTSIQTLLDKIDDYNDDDDDE